MNCRWQIAILACVLVVFTCLVCNSDAESITLEDRNIDIVKLSVYAFRDGDWADFADLHSPDYIQHSPGFDDPITWSEYELSARIVKSRLPDLKIRIVDIFAVKNKVAVRSIWEYLDYSKEFKLYYPKGVAQGSEISIFRIENSKIIEEWCEHDTAMVKRFARIYHYLERSK